MLLQTFHAKRAIEEEGGDGVILNIDHPRAINYINACQYSLLFPKTLIQAIESMGKTKNINYYFKGTITPKRNWIFEFDATIVYSNYGRDAHRKYNIDVNYYRQMCSSKFVLCPTGDCPWSYRFFEAIMCFAIPIIHDDDIFCNDYVHFKHDEPHYYDAAAAAENYKLFLSRHTFCPTNPLLQNIFYAYKRHWQIDDVWSGVIVCVIDTWLKKSEEMSNELSDKDKIRVRVGECARSFGKQENNDYYIVQY